MYSKIYQDDAKMAVELGTKTRILGKLEKIVLYIFLRNPFFTQRITLEVEI
jgi:hypothetical protein